MLLVSPVRQAPHLFPGRLFRTRNCRGDRGREGFLAAHVPPAVDQQDVAGDEGGVEQVFEGAHHIGW